MTSCRSKALKVLFSVLAMVCLFARAEFLGNRQATEHGLAGLGALPPPSGPLGVGRVTVVWTDQSRIEPLAPNHESRELMVNIWYPADSAAGAVAEYLDAVAFERALGVAGFRKQFGGAYDVIKSGVVRTHALVGAPRSRSAKRSPVLIFSPGGGMVREVYAAQLEDLASHGYIVAAISHTYDAMVTVFPDGRYAVQSQTGVDARHRGRIGVTDSACFHSNPDLTRSRFGWTPLDHSRPRRAFGPPRHRAYR